MTPNTTPRSARRNAKTVAIGAVALTAAVALPAFAIDRGGDGAVDVATAADAVESTTTTIDPALGAWLDAKSVDESLASLATLTPEQQFELQTRDWTPEQRAAFAELAQQQEELSTLYAIVGWTTAQAELQAQSARATTPAVASGSVWDRLAQCETGGNWAHPTVSGGYSGGLMFHYATWNANGGQAYAPTASGATREQQIVVAERILANSGWGAWPGCSRKLGLR
jgi:resuscitation-promoting factor RpfB